MADSDHTGYGFEGPARRRPKPVKFNPDLHRASVANGLPRVGPFGLWWTQRVYRAGPVATTAACFGLGVFMAVTAFLIGGGRPETSWQYSMIATDYVVAAAAVFWWSSRWETGPEMSQSYTGWLYVRWLTGTRRVFPETKDYVRFLAGCLVRYHKDYYRAHKEGDADRKVQIEFEYSRVVVSLQHYARMNNGRVDPVTQKHYSSV